MKILVLAQKTEKTKDLLAQLSRLNAKILMTSSYKQGIKVLGSAQGIELVIIHVEPGDSDSMTMLQAVKRASPSVTIPVIMVGPEFNKQQIRQYLELDVDDIVMLPVTDETLAGKVTSAIKAGTKTVLIVDDDDAIRDLLVQFLTYHRYRPLSAASGEEALEVLQKESVRAVVTDITMPGMSGVELLGKIKNLYPDTPVILITGNSRQFTPSGLVELGADGYFSKPFHNTELAYTLQRVISRYKYRSGRNQSEVPAESK